MVAAGRSERFGEKKELQSLGGRSVIDRSASAFLGLAGLERLCLVCPPGGESAMRAALSSHLLASLGPRLMVVPGGSSRRDSVRLGLEAVAAAMAGLPSPSAGETIVLIHDGARPWASQALLDRVVEATLRVGAAVPLAPLVDTPKVKAPGGLVGAHPDRGSFGGAQTPQGFILTGILDAHRRALAEGRDCTDDAELWAAYEGPVAWVEGDESNRKITHRRDLPREGALAPRIGEGWDVHRLVPGRALLLGGCQVPFELGEEAHSDGDVLLHAVIDAILGACRLGDIGSHFPPSDPAYEGADSRGLAAEAARLAGKAGYAVSNLDCTVIMERPRLGPHIAAMRASLAAALGVDEEAVSVKAKSYEGLGPVGEGRAVEARAVVLMVPSGS